MKVYMMITEDEYELPLAVADSPKELAEIAGVTMQNVLSLLSRGSRKYVRVEIND